MTKILTDFNCINSYRIGVLDELGIRSGVFGDWDSGHDNVHDDMNMYVIMHDQCLFIATYDQQFSYMINSLS